MNDWILPLLYYVAGLAMGYFWCFSVAKKPIKKTIYSLCPITHEELIALGYTYHPCSYYCPPFPANSGHYQLELKATRFESKGEGKGLLPIKGSEEWRAYLTHSDLPTIRRFKNLGELNHFHKGMCGAYLF